MALSARAGPSLPPLRCDLVQDVLHCMGSDITEDFIRVILKDSITYDMGLYESDMVQFTSREQNAHKRC